MPSTPTIVARIVIVLATLIGSAALAMLGVFLFRGSFGLIGFDLAPGDILAWDASLCLVFCFQHSIMIRRSFRRRVERILPSYWYGALFTFASAIVLLALLLLWQESRVVIAQLDGAWRWLARVIFFAALPGMLWSERSIAQFDPFGVRPIQAHIRGRESRKWPLTARGPYRWVRHPQYSFMLVMLWAYPDLTADRLVLNGIFSVWIVIGTILEERDLVVEFGDDYVEYQRHVPMLIPWRGRLAS